MSTFLTIKEASDRTGRSVSTIRRLVRDIVTEDSHSDRNQVHPTVAEVKKLQGQEVQFAWKLSEELLIRSFGPLDVTQKQSPEQGEGMEKVLTMLKEELQSKERQLVAKDSQIEKLGTIIGSLNDRLREGNVLMASLQQQLQLPEQTKTTATTTTVETDVKMKKAKDAKNKAVAKVMPVPAKPAVAAKPKSKSWLAVIFG